MNPSLTPTDQEKRTMVRQFEHLRLAIEGGFADDDVAERAIAFQRAYRGDARPLVDDFGAADDRGAWMRQVEAALRDELGVGEWNRLLTPVAPDDTPGDHAVVDAAQGLPFDDAAEETPIATADATCSHCGRAFTVRCAPMPGHALVTEHELPCPSCGRLTTLDLPGVIVDASLVGRGEPANPDVKL